MSFISFVYVLQVRVGGFGHERGVTRQRVMRLAIEHMLQKQPETSESIFRTEKNVVENVYP